MAGGPPPDRPPPPGGPPSDRAEYGSALAVEDFRSLRRWLAALGTVALAALALGVYALLRADESDREAADRSSVSARLRSLDNRVEELEERTQRASEESDTARLDRRLRRVEDNLTAAVDGAGDASRGVARLDERIDGVEQDLEALRRRSR